MKENVVSIIVRTKDRPKLLIRALQSIANQTYKYIEVVLVNDGGCDLDIKELQDILGGILLNYIRLKKNTGRAHAGNTGIKNAQGEYVGFLDDDDELYPDHVETLVSVLKLTEFQIAYADVEMIINRVSPDEKEVVTMERVTFSRDCSYPEIIMSNYIPFNSLLFRKGIFEITGVLDEDFELYEDWELLIRIAEKYQLFHVRKITAIYNQWSRELQINQKDIEHMKATHLKVINKHRDKISNEFILKIWQESEGKDAIIADKNAILKEKEAVLTEKINLSPHFQRVISEKDTKIVQLENEMNTIHETLGWQILETLRMAREKYFRPGTRRRKIYDLSIKSVKYIQRSGFIQFLSKVFCKYNMAAYLKDKNIYESWISKNEPDAATLKWQIKLAAEFKVRPRISIVTPVYNPLKSAFIEMIESVINQTYDNWELCLADASTEAYTREIIEQYRNKYGRIRVKYLDKNYGIAGNSNEALSLATGDFIALLDHDDTIAPFAMFEVVKSINNNPDVDFVYSNRDKISNDGKRFDPFFKPAWSPDYLLAQNYLCHLNVFRKTIIERAGGFRQGYDGSQDYDLVLRVTELTDKIVNIPKVLYHWRVVDGSASGDPEAKPYAYDAAIRALQDAVDRRGWKGTVTRGLTRGLYRVRFHVNGNSEISLIIPTKDKIDVLKKCVDSILQKTTYSNYEIVLVDNMSVEEKTFRYYEELKKISRVKILTYNKPFNFSEINNYAVSQTHTEYIVFLNNDTEIITGDWLETMLGFAQRKETGAVGAKLLYPDMTIQTAGLILDEKGNVWRSHHRHPRNSLGYSGRIQSTQNVSAVAAACMMVRREVFDEVGGFNTEYVVAHGDIDFCLKLRERNYLIVYEPHAELYHHESLTRGYEDTPEKVERLKKETQLLLRKWGHMLKNKDPYYNANLGISGPLFSEKDFINV
jgi:glycosyltransferase involved in cell wall biosynthesis